MEHSERIALRIKAMELAVAMHTSEANGSVAEYYAWIIKEVGKETVVL